MHQRPTIFMIVLLLVTSACGGPAVPSPMPTGQEVEPTTVASPTSLPSPVPTATPTPLPTATPTPRPEGWVVMETANYPSPRTDHAMAMLPDGRVLLFGGRDADGNVLGDTWIFGPEASAYSPIEGGRQLALRTSPGWLLGMGGIALWTILPQPELPEYRGWYPIRSINPPSACYGHTTVTLYDGQVMLFGGIGLSIIYGECFNDLAAFERTDWTPVRSSNNPPPSRHHHYAWAYDVYMYVQGGFGRTGTYEDLWRYDPPGNTWQQLQNPPRGAISHNAYPAIYDGTVYFLDPQRCSPAACTVNFYDMDNDTWGNIALGEVWPLVPGYSMFVQAGTQAYLMGGANWNPNTQTKEPTAEVWRMDMPTLTWTQLEDMPYPGYMGEAVYDPLDHIIVVWGGEQSEGVYVPGNQTRIYYLEP